MATFYPGQADYLEKLNELYALVGFTTFVDAAVPTGTINGSNAVFTLAHTPVGTMQLFRNGVLQTAGVDYTLSTHTITYVVAPSTGDAHVCWYRY